MAESDEKAPPPQATGRSRKLTTTVITLVLLPLLLPFLLYGFVFSWIGPMEAEAMSHCGFDCPTATYLNRLGWSLILGPSLLVVVASILYSAIGLARRTTSSEDANLFAVNLFFGICWTVLLGCIFGILFYLASIHD